MIVPPVAPEGSGHHFNGTVKEVTREEVVMVNVLEQNNVDYGLSSKQRPLTRQRRDLVRVPLLGVDKIWAYPPGQGGAAAQPAVTAPAVTSPAVTPPANSGQPPLSPAMPPRGSDFMR
jgi:hypothetical protein